MLGTLCFPFCLPEKLVQANLFGARVVGQVTTPSLEGEDSPLAASNVCVASDHAGAWYVSVVRGVNRAIRSHLATLSARLARA